MGSTRCPGLLGLLSEVPRGPPALPGDSSSVSRSHGVHQNPRATRARVRGPTVLTSSPRRLGLGPSARRTARSPGRLTLASEGLWCRPALLGDSCSVPRARRVDPLPRAIGLGPNGLQGQPTVPEDSLLAPMARGLDHISRGSWGRVPVPAVSNSSPGRLKAGSDGPPCRPAVPGESGPCPRDRGVDQLSQVTRALVRGHAGSTRSPWRLRPGSEGPRGRPAARTICAWLR